MSAYRLLYRGAASFAVGHGASVSWERVAGTSRASLVRTTHLPWHELLLADSNPDLKGQVFSIRWLAVAPRDTVVEHLYAFCDEYADWIARQRATAGALPDDLGATANDHLDICAGAASRMRAGVEELASNTDDTAWEAFRLANKAMLRQRSRVEWLRTGRPTPAPEETTVTSGGRSSSRSSSCACEASPIRSATIASSPICCGSRPAAARRRRTSG